MVEGVAVEGRPLTRRPSRVMLSAEARACREVQPRKVSSPISVVSGTAISVRAVQELKAQSPIDSRLGGRDIFVKDEHLLKVSFLISVIPLQLKTIPEGTITNRTNLRQRNDLHLITPLKNCN